MLTFTQWRENKYYKGEYVSPTNFSTRLNGRKAVEDLLRCPKFWPSAPPQDDPSVVVEWKKTFQGICNWNMNDFWWLTDMK